MGDGVRWRSITPIGSMYGIYANIWGILMYIDGKCYHIYHTWIQWDIGLSENSVALYPTVNPYDPNIKITWLVVEPPTCLKNDGRIVSWDDFPFPMEKTVPNHQPENKLSTLINHPNRTLSTAGRFPQPHHRRQQPLPEVTEQTCG